MMLRSSVSPRQEEHRREREYANPRPGNYLSQGNWTRGRTFHSAGDS
jgi:hypothetical protein